ncbi:MAG: hypothetical protein EOS42_07945 [Mesorhizobium sp.]|nr:MAG: hypothetical protein EOS42_07945 [Mesorhizobium sp.]TIV31975.1 MAG: hypothetical protein E5V90_05115 [Mesorhizobium sp.]
MSATSAASCARVACAWFVTDLSGAPVAVAMVQATANSLRTSPRAERRSA